MIGESPRRRQPNDALQLATAPILAVNWLDSTTVSGQVTAW